MTDYHLCPRCGENDDITTIHDTLYICNECDKIYNPTLQYD